MNIHKNPSIFQQSITLFSVIAITLLVFAPSLSGHFVNWDDPSYITNNPLIHDISPGNIYKIFTTYILGNYQPLTILTFAIEYHFFKLNPFPYHLTNLILHLLNILLVYLLIFRLSKKHFIAIFVCLFFALHPTRVESVAWITERKDVLFASLYLLGLIQYLRFLDSDNKVRRYFLYTSVCFILSLFAKPSAMSFPLALLLLDYIKSQKMNFRNFLQKIPFLLVSTLFGIIAIFGTYTPTNQVYPVTSTITEALNHSITPLGEVKASQELFSRSEQLIITCHALSTYLTKTLWIDYLSPYYPLPSKNNNYFTKDYYIAIAIIIVLALFLLRFKNKDFRFGLLFFLSTIFFNLPLSRVGSVETADRFTYIPYIGLFYLLALLFWKIYSYLRENYPSLTSISLIIPAILLITSIQNTRQYIPVWNNSYPLWTNVIEHHPHQIKGYFNRGNYYFEEENYTEALNDYKKALRIEPYNTRILYNMGNCFLRLGYLRWALETYQQVLTIDEDYILAIEKQNQIKKILNSRRE